MLLNKIFERFEVFITTFANRTTLNKENGHIWSIFSIRIILIKTDSVSIRNENN